MDGSKLVNGHTRSCGCLITERIAALNRSHGATVGCRFKRTAVPKEYQTWNRIKSRCYNPNVPEHPFYGGRGITMCDDWRHDYSAFLADMGDAPTRKHSIERIDNDGPYEPGNCRWATPREQARNRRSSVRVKLDGELVLLVEAAERFGINYHTLYCAVVVGGESATSAVRRLRRQ